MKKYGTIILLGVLTFVFAVIGNISIELWLSGKNGEIGLIVGFAMFFLYYDLADILCNKMNECKRIKTGKALALNLMFRSLFFSACFMMLYLKAHTNFLIFSIMATFCYFFGHEVTYYFTRRLALSEN
ncbi:hypothetical protein IJM16_04700 [Candidatus Saccharibacteria bacterium]|nr:hypothetical protein [Candidatus Saccharibacteria bacterium]